MQLLADSIVQQTFRTTLVGQNYCVTINGRCVS